MLAALQVMSPSLEGFKDCQQLPVVGLISSLCRNYLSGKKGYRITSARVIWGQLTENSTNSIVRKIRLNSDLILRIKMI